MKSKKIPALFAVLLVFTFLVIKTPILQAQQPKSSNDKQTPSDLSLDLNLAEQNPAPLQKQIIQAQITQAKVVTQTGDQVAVEVKNVVPPEIQTESAKDAVNPDQSTSEQVITTNVGGKNGPNENSLENQNLPSENFQNNNSGGNSNNISNSPGSDTNTNSSNNTEKMIPGTTIPEPNDNAAPHESIPPQGAPSESAPANSPPESISSTSPSETNQPPDQSNTIPPENGSAVQGVSIKPSFWQQLLNQIIYGKR